MKIGVGISAFIMVSILAHSCRKNDDTIITDKDGNIYYSVQIGSQTWMTENLKTTRFNNGKEIPLVPDKALWISLNSPACCWYDNDDATYGKYGALYNWYAVETGRLCPSGWHVPAEEELRILITYLGGYDIAGGKLKTMGTTDWLVPNTGATNESGFSALPAGFRYKDGRFMNFGQLGQWFSSSESSSGWINGLMADNYSSSLSLFGANKKDGLSVRCLQDAPVQAIIPVVITDSIPVLSITFTDAYVSGAVTGDGGASVTMRGFCWSSLHSPTTADSLTHEGTGTGFFSSRITGLQPSRTYKVRAYAKNSCGTAYGEEVSFSTLYYPIRKIVFNPGLTYGTVTDIDGNIYKTIQIGTQTWMAENLKTEKYNDGVSIPNVTDNTWEYLTTGAYCWYENDAETYKNIFGALYNWHAVNTGKLCPTGWHVPTDVEWTAMTTYLGGSDVAGDKLKETGTTHWRSPNDGATNESGFTALPGGEKYYFGGSFYNTWSCGYWWSSTEYSSTNAYFRSLVYEVPCISSINISKQGGFSVRCLKD